MKRRVLRIHREVKTLGTDTFPLSESRNVQSVHSDPFFRLVRAVLHATQIAPSHRLFGPIHTVVAESLLTSDLWCCATYEKSGINILDQKKFYHRKDQRNPMPIYYYRS